MAESDSRWRTNKQTGRAFPLGARDSMADIDPDAAIKEQFRREHNGRNPTLQELAQFKAQLKGELLAEEESELGQLQEGQIDKMTTAQLERVIRKAEGDGGPMTGGMPPTPPDQMVNPPPDDQNGGVPIFGAGESLFGEGQPIFDSQASTKPAEEPDDEELAEDAMDYFNDKIVNATSQEEINGWKQDIVNDPRLLQGEKAKLLKYADTQQELLDLQHSEVDIAEDIHKGVKEKREQGVKAEKEKEEDEDRSIFGAGEPLFGNTPIFGEKESTAPKKKKKRAKEKSSGIFGDAEPLFP